MTRCRGFSLVEAAIASAVLAVLVTASLTAMGRLAASRARDARRSLAQGFASAMIGEIQSKAYADPVTPGAPLGADDDDGYNKEDRAMLDDVDDFHGIFEEPILDAQGKQVSPVGPWRRECSVERVSIEPGGLIKVAGVETGVKRITVTVSYDHAVLASRTVLRTKGWDRAAP